MIDISEIKITRQRRKTLAIHVLDDGTFEVRAPKLIPKFMINDFIRKNVDWIERNMKTASVHAAPKKKYINGEKFLYLGCEYTLDIGNYVRLEIKGDRLCFPKAIVFRIKKEIETWYIQRAREIIKAELEHNAKIMNTTFASVSFSDTRSKWGSCSSDNRLQFSWRLVMAPHLVLRYVVVHELAHTKEKNHSHSFWNRVRPINPSYKEQIKWLKVNGNRLFV